MNYESTVSIESQTYKGVVLVVSRMSFGRRLELMRMIREIAIKMEFHQAGKSETDKMEAAILGSEIDRLYLSWGLAGLVGLTIDGETATAEILASIGPEDLLQEALMAIKEQSGLTEKETKN